MEVIKGPQKVGEAPPQAVDTMVASKHDGNMRGSSIAVIIIMSN